MSFTVRRLGADDVSAMRQLNKLFAEAFEDPARYASAPPDDDYLERLLARDQVVVVVGTQDESIIGGLVGYVLEKLEQERSEIYIYDLAVEEKHRRRGVASALIGEVQRIAAKTGACAIYVQADYGDEPAIALYEKLGTREEVMHFDIAPRATR